MSSGTLHLASDEAGDVPLTGKPQQFNAPKEVPLGDTGLVALIMLARFHNIAADANQLAHDFREAGQVFGVPQILLAAKRLGLKAKQVATQTARLAQTPLPALAIEKDGRFIILARVDEQKVLIQDPRAERPQVL